MSSRRRSGSRAAVTLVEVVVATALLVVVFGVTMGIFIDTGKACDRGEKRLAMQSHAELISKEVASVLRTAASPDSVDAGLSSGATIFRSDECTLVGASDYEGERLYFESIANEADDAGRGYVIRHDRPLGADKGEGSAPKRIGLQGGISYSTTIQFEYATKVDPETLKPNYERNLPPGEYPVLVRYRIQVKDAEGKVTEPMILDTTVRMLSGNAPGQGRSAPGGQ